MLNVTCYMWGIYCIYVHVGYINNIHPVDTIMYMYVKCYMLHVTYGEYTVYINYIKRKVCSVRVHVIISVVWFL